MTRSDDEMTMMMSRWNDGMMLLNDRGPIQEGNNCLLSIQSIDKIYWYNLLKQSILEDRQFHDKRMNLRSSLLFLPVFLSTMTTSMQTVTASWCADGQRERINNINTLIADYISKHNIDVLREESAEDLCQRKFISNYQFSMVSNHCRRMYFESKIEN